MNSHYEPYNKKKKFGKEDVECSAVQFSDGLANNEKIHKKRIPKFRLKSSGQFASLSVVSEERIPLMLTDVQHLLLHSLFGDINLSESPRWYALEKSGNISQITCLILEGVSIHHWETYKEKFTSTSKLFDCAVEILTPSSYNGSLAQELVLVPLSDIEKDSMIQKYGSMNLALEVRKDLMIMMRAVFPVRAESLNDCLNFHGEDKFPRTQLILSAWQLLEENYPVPLKGKLKNAYVDYVMTKDEYEPVTSNSPMFGLDCEMCLTNAGSELTRVSLVNEKHEVVYESLVKPYNEITDYLTRFSGITKSLLSDVNKRLEEVQNDIRNILPPDAILVGQSLNFDLHALKMMHPYVIDTSVIYNFTGERTRKPKLKVLAREFLNEIIQGGNNGHCPIEDSVTSLKLVQLKLSKSVEFGDAVHTNRQKYKENMKIEKKEQFALSIFNHMIEQKKTSIIVGREDITGDYHSYLTQAKDTCSLQLKKGKFKKIKLTTVDEVEDVFSTLSTSVKEYNFAMAHLKYDLSDRNEIETLETIDKNIESVWNNIPSNGLYVVVLGGTQNDNGLTMINVKNR